MLIISRKPAPAEEDVTETALPNEAYTVANTTVPPAGAKIRKDAVLFKRHFYCAYGPEDLSSNLPEPKQKGPDERRRLTEHGESIKRGCQAQFSLTVRMRTPDIAELRVYHRDHLNKQGQPCHGKDCKAPGKHHTQPHLSEECKAMVKAQLLAGINYDAILQHNRGRLYRQYQLEHTLDSIQAAKRQMEVRIPHSLHPEFAHIVDRQVYAHAKDRVSHSGVCACQAQQTGNPRDYYLTRQDIINIDMKLTQGKWRLHSNQAQSVRLFTEQNPELVLLYQEQGLHKGAAEAQAKVAQAKAALELQPQDILQSVARGHNGLFSGGGNSAAAG